MVIPASNVLDCLDTNITTLHAVEPELLTIEVLNAVQSQCKVTDFGTNGKPIYDFLLVNNTNLHRILHRFQDITLYW